LPYAIDQKKAATVREALEAWQRKGILTPELAAQLNSDLQVIPFDWRRLAKYSLWVSIVCVVTAVVSVLSDHVFMRLLESIFDAAPIVRAAFAALVAAGFYIWGVKRKRQSPEKVYSNEALLFLGVLATAASVSQVGMAFDTGSGHFSILLLLSFVIYAVLAFAFASNLIWIFALAAFGSWYGTETGYESGWGAYYLGMNYPMRFVLFGAALLLATGLSAKAQWARIFFRATLAMGLLYFFIALWLLSIFGNYGSMDSWYHAGHLELLQWSVLFGLAAAAAVGHGLKYDNGMTKGFGITFFFINLYTKFFEIFWDHMHKAIFFAILAVSFWLIGTRAERIWSLGPKKSADAKTLK